MNTLPRLVACLLATGIVILSACSAGNQSATSPSPTNPANVGGAWSGTLTFNGTIAQGPFSMTLTQPAGTATVTGTWTGKSDWSGTIDGSIAGSTFAGQLVWNYVGIGAAGGLTKCNATAALLGNAGGNSMSWTSSAINRATSSVSCDLGVSSIRIDATK
jgi:hypothetical protein